MNTWKLSLIQSPSNNFYQLIRSTPSWYAQLIGASDWNGKGNLRCLLEYLSASQQRGTTLRQASSSLCRSFLTTGCPVPQSSPSIQDILPSICRGHILTPPPQWVACMFDTIELCVFLICTVMAYTDGELGRSTSTPETNLWAWLSGSF